MKQGGSFRLFGIFGYPLAHTLSPQMQEAAFQKAGLKAFYLPLEFHSRLFMDLMKRLDRLPLTGFNVTVPYKERILPYLDALTEEARHIGAVNTVYRRGNRWIGTNTDAFGFVRSLEKDAGFRAAGKSALIVGAGGAARAAAFGLARQGARQVLIANRRFARAQELVRFFRKRFRRCRWTALKLEEGSIRSALEQSDVVINATAVGLKARDASVIPASWIPRGGKDKKLFFDLIYRPAETSFLKAAKKRGHRILNGIGMLAYQGSRAWECWTAQKAPEVLMKKTLIALLQKA